MHSGTCLSSDETLSLGSLQCQEMADAGPESAHVSSLHACCLSCRHFEPATT